MIKNNKNNFSFKALILAGGSGTRLWPLSRKAKPKQFLSLHQNKTLLQMTYERINEIFINEDIWLAGSENQKRILQKELPKVHNFSFEPEMKNTAPAIGLAILKIWLKSPKAIVVTVNSDHFIKNEKEYRRLVLLAGKIVNQYREQTVLIGVKTEYPEIGYGYIKTGDVFLTIRKDKILKVKKFIEKPNLKLAEKYHKDFNFFWNPAIFVFSVEHMLNLFKQHLPKHYSILMKIKNNINNNKKVKELFGKMEKISFDNGIMEKENKLLMIPGSFGWSDIGSFQSIYEVFKNKEQNFIHGLCITVDSAGNLIYSSKNKLTAMIDVHDSLIINTDDAVLIAPLKNSQAISKLVKIIENKKLNKYL